MKANKWLGLLATLILPIGSAPAQTPTDSPPPAANPAAPAVSPAAAEVVKMAEAGTSDDVLLAYVKNSTSTYDLSADQILYLRDIGLSSPVITAMLSHDSDLRSQAGSYTYDQKLYPPTAPPPADTAPAPAPAPAAAPEPAPAPAPVAVEAPLTPPVYVSSPPPEVSYFYDDLSPYGTWVQLDGFGWCWQPRVVVINHGWRPYCDSGHWVFTDAGWFWQSDYSWGWAPFHYGRWYMHDHCGWVWMPDRVWGPAWVTWRYEGEHCGWAPLPPHADFDAHLGYRFNGVHVALNFDFGLRPEHYTFIAMRDFNDHDFAHHRLPPAQVTQIYNHTTIINNYVVKNNTVVNEGIKVDRVSAATHTSFKKVAIRDTPAWSPAAANSRVSGRTELAVYRPQLKAPARPVNMVAQKVDNRHPVIQHAPVAPAKVQRPLVASSTTSGPNRSVQNQNPTSWSRPSAERAPAYSQPQPSPKYRSTESVTPSSPSASSTTSAGRAESARPAAPATRPQQEYAPANRASSTYSSPAPANRQYYPLRSGPTPPPESSRPSSQPQNSHTYYPKGYYQSGETRALPPMYETRPADSRGQPNSNGRPNGNQPRRNDQ